MRRISPLERLRLFGRAGIDVVATLGRSVLFLVSALFGRSRAGKPLQLLIKTGTIPILVGQHRHGKTKIITGR